MFNSVAYCDFYFCGELFVKVGSVLFYGCIGSFVVFGLGCACYLLFWICGILNMMLWKWFVVCGRLADCFGIWYCV